MSTPVVCPECATPIPSEFFRGVQFGPCLGCNSPLLARVFPALLRPAQQGVSGEHITEAGQAACFYHPGKIAHVPCDACGRFVCALCDVELYGKHLCPSCVESGQRKGTLTTFEGRRVLWDNIALSVAVLPVATLFLAGISLVTAPAAIILALYGWRKPGSLAPRSKMRFVLAILFSLLTLGGWGVMFYFISVTASISQ